MPKNLAEYAFLNSENENVGIITCDIFNMASTLQIFVLQCLIGLLNSYV
jgi:hypothetical protein